MKNTIKALFRSGVVCLFCISLLTSSSYAWYTEYAEGGAEESAVLLTSDGEEATVGAELSWKADWDATTWNVVEGPGASESTSAIFAYDYWEPGFTQVRYVKLDNVGTKPLQYYLRVSETETYPVGIDLAQVIDVYFIEGVTAEITRESLATAKYAGTLAQVILASSDHDGVAHGAIEKNQNMTAAIVLQMQETAGNDYQAAYKKFNLKISLSPFETSSTTL